MYSCTSVHVLCLLNTKISKADLCIVKFSFTIELQHSFRVKQKYAGNVEVEVIFLVL